MSSNRIQWEAIDSVFMNSVCSSKSCPLTRILRCTYCNKSRYIECVTRVKCLDADKYDSCSSPFALNAAGVGLVSGAGYLLNRHHVAIRDHVFSGHRQSQVREVGVASARSMRRRLVSVDQYRTRIPPNDITITRKLENSKTRKLENAKTDVSAGSKNRT